MRRGSKVTKDFRIVITSFHIQLKYFMNENDTVATLTKHFRPISRRLSIEKRSEKPAANFQARFSSTYENSIAVKRPFLGVSRNTISRAVSGGEKKKKTELESLLVAKSWPDFSRSGRRMVSLPRRKEKWLVGLPVFSTCL